MLFLVCVVIFVVLACVVLPGIALAVMLFLDGEDVEPRGAELGATPPARSLAAAVEATRTRRVMSPSRPAGLSRSLVPTVSPVGRRHALLHRLAAWCWCPAARRRVAGAIVRIGQKWSLLPSKPVSGVR